MFVMVWVVKHRIFNFVSSATSDVRIGGENDGLGSQLKWFGS